MRGSLIVGRIIRVARGICFDDIRKPFHEHKVLLILIREKGGWRAPGGHGEKNEGFERAVIREFKGETGLTVRTRALLFKKTETPPVGMQAIFCYFLALWGCSCVLRQRSLDEGEK